MAIGMHQSIFSYGLTRSYPYPWFTWLVVIGGIVATALFSVINIVAGGYETISIYVTDLNKTQYPNPLPWNQKMPWSLVSKVHTACEEQVFTIGSQFYTNNSLLEYTLVRITTENNITDSRSSLTYRNDILHDCVVHDLFMSRRQNDDDFFRLIIDVSCTVYDSNTHVPTKITIEYDYKSSNDYDFSHDSTAYHVTRTTFRSAIYHQLDKHTRSASWWGRILLAASGGFLYDFQIDLETNVTDSAIHFGHPSAKVQNESRSQLDTRIFANKRTHDVTLIGTLYGTALQSSIDRWSSLVGNDVLNYINCGDDSTGHDIPCSDQRSNSDEAKITLYWEAVAHVFYSFVMTDLGQSTSSNMFADDGQFIKFLTATNSSHLFDDFDFKGPDSILIPWWLQGYPNYPFNSTEPSKFYNWYGTGLPQVLPAVINTQYLCQVPRLKPLGSVIVNVIVANLVFLQALWTITNWTVKVFLDRKDPRANDCLGCVRNSAAEKDEEEIHMGTSSKTVSLIITGERATSIKSQHSAD